MSNFRHLAASFAALAIAASTASAAVPQKYAGPWDLMLIGEKDQVVAASGISSEKCEEGLRIAVREGHTVVCMRYMDSVKSSDARAQRYGEALYPVVSPAECAIARRMLGVLTRCLYR